jgi:hypothetical protein
MPESDDPLDEPIDDPIEEPIQDPRDNPSERVQNILARTGALSPWDFSQLLDQALIHAAVPARQDTAGANLNWRPLGPRNLGGRIRCLAQDERNPQTIYAGSAQGGLWRTQDSGDSWTALDNFSPPTARQALAVGAIGVSYSNPEIIYVGTGEPTRAASGGPRDILGNGLFRSTDYGNTFTRIDHPTTGILAFGQFERIVVDPWEPSRLWIASSDGGIARGTPPTGLAVLPVLQADNVVHTSAPVLGAQRASDIMVDFGSSRTTPPTTVTVYVALWGNGVYKAQYNRITDIYLAVAGLTWTRITPRFPRNFTRIKLTQCRSQPNWIGAVAGISRDRASNVFISMDKGDSWRNTGRRRGDGGRQARYDLVLEFHPNDPSIFITGSVELFLGRHTGRSNRSHRTRWSKIIDWEKHDKGDRAQHADQHALFFDVANPTRIWVGNDGGVSTSPDLGGRWRERGLGINAAQFNDITTHPKFPYIFAGGLQDNGTWLSYGGHTWYHVNGADGGEVAFHPTDPRKFITTWQSGLDQTQIISTNDDFGDEDYMNQLPDIPQVGDKNINHRAVLSPITRGFSAAHSPLFVGVVASHPATANDVLVGRSGAAYHSTNGTRFRRLNRIPSFINRTDQVSKVLYSPLSPDLKWWVTTNNGQVFFTNDGNATTWNNVTPPPPVPPPPAPAIGIADATITGICINQNNEAIVAVSATIRPRTAGANAQALIYLSGDSGRNWREISGRFLPSVSTAANQFSPSVATSIVFDPTSSADVANPQTIYCACFAGVYVIRNAQSPTSATSPAFAPQWRTFNSSLPLALIFDLKAVTYEDELGTTQHLLRCATHARGAYECDLSGVARVKLLIRDNIIDDGKTYAAAHLETSKDDPRMSAGNTMVLNRSIDIRIDTPPYRFLGSVIDGLEMDEMLRSDDLSAGIMNIVYVQLHNVGFGQTNSAELHLFWASVTTTPPDLQANFWNTFPNVPDGGTWQKVGTLPIDFLESGQPRVMAFNWNMPSNLADSVALLAIASDPIHDNLDTSTLGNVADPLQAASFIGKERRTALYISPVKTSPADASFRDGFDDTGLFGETAWGSQSHDIIVVQTTEADPAVAFSDQNDKRESDVVDGSEVNQIYVRAYNKGGTDMENAQVEVFRIAVDTLQDPNTWVSLGVSLPLTTIPAQSNIILPAITWPPEPEPAPNKQYVLIALIQGDDNPRPDFISRVDSIQTFWKLLLEDVDSGNAVVRGLNWQA